MTIETIKIKLYEGDCRASDIASEIESNIKPIRLDQLKNVKDLYEYEVTITVKNTGLASDDKIWDRWKESFNNL